MSTTNWLVVNGATRNAQWFCTHQKIQIMQLNFPKLDVGAIQQCALSDTHHTGKSCILLSKSARSLKRGVIILKMTHLQNLHDMIFLVHLYNL